MRRGRSTAWLKLVPLLQAAPLALILIVFLLLPMGALVVTLAAGMAFRRRFRGTGPLFTLTVASLIIPSVLVSMRVGRCSARWGR